MEELSVNLVAICGDDIVFGYGCLFACLSGIISETRYSNSNMLYVPKSRLDLGVTKRTLVICLCIYMPCLYFIVFVLPGHQGRILFCNWSPQYKYIQINKHILL